MTTSKSYTLYNEIKNFINKPICQYPILEKEMLNYDSTKRNLCIDICNQNNPHSYGNDAHRKFLFYSEGKCLDLCFMKVQEVEKVVAWQLDQLKANSKDSPILSNLINID